MEHSTKERNSPNPAPSLEIMVVAPLTDICRRMEVAVVLVVLVLIMVLVESVITPYFQHPLSVGGGGSAFTVERG